MTAHRLNHHDILAIEAIKARDQAQADANRRADRIVIVGAVACIAVMVVLHAMGWLA